MGALEWSIEEVCAAYFGLLRALLSPEARLRVQYSGGRANRAVVDLLNAEGWFAFDDVLLANAPTDLLPREVVLHNAHLPSRFPFAGLTRTAIGTYPWRRAT